MAFEMCLQLQSSGEQFSLTLLDGSHCYVKMFTSVYSEEKNMAAEEKELEALSSFLERNLQVDSGYTQVSLTVSACRMLTSMC